MANPQQERWRYMGRRLNAKDKISYVYQDANGDVLWYGEELLTAPIGSVVEVVVARTPEGCSVLGEGRRYVEDRWDDTARRWAAEDRTAYTRHTELKIARSAVRDRNLYNDLTWLREAYWATPRMRQPAFLAAVISAVVGNPPPKKEA